VFEATDATELVHHHLAKRPFFSLEVRRRVPHAVRDVVLKLLAKTPEERYQSAAGIVRDLSAAISNCATAATSTLHPGGGRRHGSVRPRPAAVRPEAESALLLDAFAQVSAGQSGWC
jgi:serine/threonine protein kinase